MSNPGSVVIIDTLVQKNSGTYPLVNAKDVGGDGTSNILALTTLGSNSLPYGKIQKVGTFSLLGNPTNGSTTISEITLGSNLSFSGNVLSATGTLNINPIANNTLLGNISGSSQIPVATALSALLDSSIGSTQGDILYRNGSQWTVLAPGTSGQILTSGGSAANPSWASAGSGSVAGPTSSIIGNVATFANTTGNIIQDQNQLTVLNSLLANAGSNHMDSSGDFVVNGLLTVPQINGAVGVPFYLNWEGSTETLIGNTTGGVVTHTNTLDNGEGIMSIGGFLGVQNPGTSFIFSVLENNSEGQFVVWSPTQTGGNGLITLYNANTSSYVGLSDALPLPGGVTGFGGLLSGMGVQASTTGSGYVCWGVYDSSGNQWSTQYDTGQTHFGVQEDSGGTEPPLATVAINGNLAIGTDNSYPSIQPPANGLVVVGATWLDDGNIATNGSGEFVCTTFAVLGTSKLDDGKITTNGSGVITAKGYSTGNSATWVLGPFVNTGEPITSNGVVEIAINGETYYLLAASIL